MNRLNSNFIKLIGLFVLLNSFNYLFADKISTFRNNGIKQERRTDFRRAHEFGFMAGALKYANFGLQYQYSISPIKWFTVQGVLGVKVMNYDVYSTSDKHRIQAAWLPISLGSRFHFVSKETYKGYAFGKYGWAIGLGSDNNKIKSKPCIEYGAGTLLSVLRRRDMLLKLEVGRQEYSLKGEARGSYQSTIKYDLLFNSYFFRVGFVLEID